MGKRYLELPKHSDYEEPIRTQSPVSGIKPEPLTVLDRLRDGELRTLLYSAITLVRLIDKAQRKLGEPNQQPTTPITQHVATIDERRLG